MSSNSSAPIPENGKPPKKQASIEMFLKRPPLSTTASGHSGSEHKETRQRKRLRPSQSCINDTDLSNPNLKEAKELQDALIELAHAKHRHDVQPEILKLSSDGSSWMVHITNYKPPLTQESFEQIWSKHPKTYKSIGKLFGRDKECFENRYSQSYGVPMNYSGYTNDVPRPIEEDAVLLELMHEVNSVVRKDRGPYNGCLVNWYLPEHTIAAHSDDERSMKYQSPIFSLSWGGPRRFVVQPKKKYSHSPERYASADITVHSGDLLIMGGSLQQTHTHEVPKWRKTKDLFVPTRRINWTVRACVNGSGSSQSTTTT